MKRLSSPKGEWKDLPDNGRKTKLSITSAPLAGMGWLKQQSREMVSSPALKVLFLIGRSPVSKHFTHDYFIMVIYILCKMQ